MKIHEYQAKQILSKYNIPVPIGRVTEKVEEVEKITKELGGDIFVVKAQAHTGGRGKAGGVKVVRSTTEAVQAARSILGMQLITHQTGPQGKKIHKILIEKGIKIQKEFYASIIVDRQKSCPVLMISTEGGMDIEEIAQTHPEKIIIEPLSVIVGISSFQIRRISKLLGLTDKNHIRQLIQILTGLVICFTSEDASIVEINPLALTDQGLLAVDAKINIDDNAIYRHPETAAMRDKQEEDPKEVQASEAELSYISLDGNIGCMVNGAGLAMATMDIIKLYGGEPANFLDVGGGATTERVTKAFKIILSDPQVKGILVNIFGGIMKCDIIAEGIVFAAKEIKLHVPLVVRLEGTNVDKGKQILRESGLKITSANDMKEAAQAIVKAVQETR